MSRLRLILAVVTLLTLGVLFGWQHRREQLVKGCLDGGGVWNGASSNCQTPVRPILRRDLERG